MRIGIIGAGQFGGGLTRRLGALGHDVFVANSRAPETLADLAAETGATPVSVTEVARSGEVVVVTIPEGRVRELGRTLFGRIPKEAIVVDTGNYYPRQRDGRIEEIEAGVPESLWVARQLGRPVVKAFNTMYAGDLMSRGLPRGAPGRLAYPVSGDDTVAKAVIIDLLDELGFDGVDAGGLDESWRHQPGTPIYGPRLDRDGVLWALARATRERSPEWRASEDTLEASVESGAA